MNWGPQLHLSTTTSLSSAALPHSGQGNTETLSMSRAGNFSSQKLILINKQNGGQEDILESGFSRHQPRLDNLSPHKLLQCLISCAFQYIAFKALFLKMLFSSIMLEILKDKETLKKRKFQALEEGTFLSPAQQSSLHPPLTVSCVRHRVASTAVLQHYWVPLYLSLHTPTDLPSLQTYTWFSEFLGSLSCSLRLDLI